MNRRDFLWFSGVATGSVSIPALFSGCAIDPVTGSAMLSLVSEEQEVAIDNTQSPHQFSADYGQNTDAALNNYIAQVGAAVAKVSHRPHMPYSYRVVDANHVNAYTFPGGTMAVTRGIMVEMESEAELAGLLGHEIGHVNARHSAERATKGMLAQAAVGLASSAIGDDSVRQVVSGVGALSATALLAKYSRDNEREADKLGMEYMVQAGANPVGMVDLMELLNSLHRNRPNALQIMFSSHPMSAERLSNATAQMESQYGQQMARNLSKERYMDHTANLRKQKPLIKALANADMAVSAGELVEAERQWQMARKYSDADYSLWVIGAKIKMTKGDNRGAVADMDRAASFKPNEAMPLYMKGVNYLELQQGESALAAFRQYERRLPGNPLTNFFIGYSHEMLTNLDAAADAYRQFLQQVQQGAQAEHAYRRLVEWGKLS